LLTLRFVRFTVKLVATGSFYISIISVDLKNPHFLLLTALNGIEVGIIQGYDRLKFYT